MEININQYLPDIDSLDPETVREVRERLEAIVRTWLPDVDTRPNSPFGDLHLTPLAYLTAAGEIAASRMLSDLDMANVAGGTVWHCEFVERFLNTLGMRDALTLPSRGSVLLLFSANREVLIPKNARLSLQNQLFEIALDAPSGNVRIGPAGGPSGQYDLLLRTVDSETWGVHLPVAGPPGIQVLNGEEALTDIEDPDLVGVSAAGDFDRGLQPEKAVDMARRLPLVFASSDLSTPKSAVSWAFTNFPSLVGASAVCSGDEEMRRGRSNLLGLAEGVTDFHIKGGNLLSASASLPLVRDFSTPSRLAGKLDLLGIPLLIDRVYRTLDGPEAEDAEFTVFSRSADPARAPGLTCAYSQLEELGIEVYDDPDDEYYTEGADPQGNLTDGAASLTVTGSYQGDRFSALPARHIEIVFTGEDDGAALATLKDRNSLSEFPARFSGSGTGTLEMTGDIQPLLNGLTVKVNSSGGSQFVPADLIGKKFDFSFRGYSAAYTVEYRYDPAADLVASTLAGDDHRPASADVLVRTFITCKVTLLRIKYRKKPGKEIDKTAIVSELRAYFSRLVWPELYEQAAVHEIVLYHGAAGIRSVEQTGLIFRSQGSKIWNADSEEWDEVPPAETSTLIPEGIEGAGNRNIHYILAEDAIELVQV